MFYTILSWKTPKSFLHLWSWFLNRQRPICTSSFLAQSPPSSWVSVTYDDVFSQNSPSRIASSLLFTRCHSPSLLLLSRTSGMARQKRRTPTANLNRCLPQRSRPVVPPLNLDFLWFRTIKLSLRVPRATETAALTYRRLVRTFLLPLRDHTSSLNRHPQVSPTPKLILPLLKHHPCLPHPRPHPHPRLHPMMIY